MNSLVSSDLTPALPRGGVLAPRAGRAYVQSPVPFWKRNLAILLSTSVFGCGSTPDLAPRSNAFAGLDISGVAPNPERICADLYARARDLEEQGFKSEAVATYTEILEQFGEYEDATARRQDLAAVLGMSLPELLIPERPTSTAAPIETGAVTSAPESEPRLPPNPNALERETLWIEMYQRALRYESEHRYLTAIDVYTELLEGRGSYKDVALRRSTLVSLQRLAEQLYARGVAATETEDAVHNFEQIEIFWPGFRDIAERLKRLRGNS